MRRETDDQAPPERVSDGGVTGLMHRPHTVRTDRDVLEALILAVRGQVRTTIPALERSMRSLRRGSAIEQAEALRRALWRAADEAAFKAGLDREDMPGSAEPPAGTTWAW